MSTFLQLSVRVGDGMPGIPDDDLVADLTHMVHDEAAAHYGRPRWSRGCQSQGFAGPGGREAFEAALRRLPAEAGAQVDLYLAEWDASIRPIAVMHWWSEPVH